MTDEVQQSTFVLILLKKGSQRITILCITYKQPDFRYSHDIHFANSESSHLNGRMHAGLFSPDAREHFSILSTELWCNALQCTVYQYYVIRHVNKYLYCIDHIGKMELMECIVYRYRYIKNTAVHCCRRDLKSKKDKR